VGEQQRERAWPATFSVHQVQSVTRNLSTLLAQGVEPELKRVRVKGTPVLQKGLQPIAGHASIPAWTEVSGLPVAIEPAAELSQCIGVQSTAFLNDSHAPVIVHASHRVTRLGARRRRSEICIRRRT
jgi:hypothetical protein